jgi:lactam utilization protein B
VLDRVFARLQQEQILALRSEHVCLDSTTIKVHPDGTGALKKTGRRPSGAPAADARLKFIWLPRVTGAR